MAEYGRCYDPESKGKHNDLKLFSQARPKKNVMSAWVLIGESINSADITNWTVKQMIKSKLESLLSTANQRVSMLEKKANKQGLAYKGEDAIKCGFGNTFQSELSVCSAEQPVTSVLMIKKRLSNV